MQSQVGLPTVTYANHHHFKKKKPMRPLPKEDLAEELGEDSSSNHHHHQFNGAKKGVMKATEPNQDYENLR